MSHLYAVVDNGIVVNMTEAESTSFAESMGWIHVPDDALDVTMGWLWDGVSFSAPTPTARNLEEERILKFSAINSKAHELLAPYAADYPQGEVYSWPTQVAEAEAFDADPQSPTPLLSGIAAQRGTTVAHLVTRVKVKASAYATIIGPIIGKRQYFEDLALSAATVEELDEIDITTGWPA